MGVYQGSVIAIRAQSCLAIAPPQKGDRPVDVQMRLNTENAIEAIPHRQTTYCSLSDWLA